MHYLPPFFWGAPRSTKRAKSQSERAFLAQISDPDKYVDVEIRCGALGRAKGQRGKGERSEKYVRGKSTQPPPGSILSTCTIRAVHISERAWARVTCTVA